MRKRSALTLCLIAMLLTLSTTPVMSETPVSESATMLRSECEKELTEQWLSHDEELMALGQEHENALKQRGIECEERVRTAAAEGATGGAAEVARELLPKIAGLEALAAALRRWIVGGTILGLIIGGVLTAILL